MSDPGATQCTRCGKKLRSDNSKGVCADAQKCASRISESDGSVYDVKTTSEQAPARRAKSDTLKRFRVVAAALDEDADALLEAFAESWLAQLKERVSGS
jgi:hypothetical protein